MDTIGSTHNHVHPHSGKNEAGQAHDLIHFQGHGAFPDGDCRGQARACASGSKAAIQNGFVFVDSGDDAAIHDFTRIFDGLLGCGVIPRNGDDLPRFTQPVINEDFSISANSLGVR